MGSQRGGKRRGGRYQQAPNLLVSAVSSPHYQQFNKASPNKGMMFTSESSQMESVHHNVQNVPRVSVSSTWKV